MAKKIVVVLLLISGFLAAQKDSILEKKHYKNFHDELIILSKDNFEKTVFEYFDFISWTKSKLENVPFRRIVEEKAQR